MSVQRNGGCVPPQAPQSTWENEKTWAMLCHAATFATFIPFGNIIGPLVIWILKKDAMPFVNDQGKEALNFQISIMIYYAVSALLIFGLVGIVLLPAVAIFGLVMTIIAIIKVSEGRPFRYPLCMRFVK